MLRHTPLVLFYTPSSKKHNNYRHAYTHSHKLVWSDFSDHRARDAATMLVCVCVCVVLMQVRPRPCRSLEEVPESVLPHFHEAAEQLVQENCTIHVLVQTGTAHRADLELSSIMHLKKKNMDRYLGKKNQMNKVRTQTVYTAAQCIQTPPTQVYRREIP